MDLPFGEIKKMKAYSLWELNLLPAQSHLKGTKMTKCFATPFGLSNPTDSQLVEDPDVNFVTDINCYLIHLLQWLTLHSATPKN